MASITHDQWTRRGTYVQTRDGKTFFVHAGKGFPLIMLHLFGGSSWWVSKVLDPLAAHFSVYAVDIIGFGHSDTPRRNYTIEDFGAWLVEFMDNVGIQKTHLLGAHGSSMASVNVATTHPERIQKLILDGPIPWTTEEGKKLFQERFRHHWLDEQERPKPLVQWGGSPRFQSLPEPERTQAVFRLADDWDPHANWWLMGLRSVIDFSDRKRLHLIKAPTLLLYGEEDMLRGTEPWMPGGERRMLEQIKGSRHVVIGGCGSIPAFERPEEFTRAVLDFLKDP